VSGGAGRIRSLDGLRGAAAVVVVIYHALLLLLGNDGVPVVPVLGALWNGHAAVIIFFVLSGLVLARPYWASEGDAWAPFVIRRLCRIWPLFAVSILIVPVLLLGVEAAGGSWRPEPGPAELAGELAMLDLAVPEPLNGSTWTLVHEMRVSLIFPLLIGAMRLAGHRAVPIALGFSTVAAMAGDFVPYPWTASWFLTLAFIWLFVMGAEIARCLPAIRARLGRLSPAWGLALVAGLLLPLSLDRKTHILGVGIAPLIDASAGLLVASAVGIAPFASFLETPILQWFGRVSYSLYLIHGPLMNTAVAASPGSMPRVIPVLVGAAVSLPVALFLYHAVERPTLRLGQRLADRLRHGRNEPQTG
jgi:peptidoglycan/LPS O-acetylase OafA/YrhL